jgi:mRNA degradation ribonuclease J1/J2
MVNFTILCLCASVDKRTYILSKKWTSQFYVYVHELDKRTYILKINRKYTPIETSVQFTRFKVYTVNCCRGYTVNFWPITQSELLIDLGRLPQNKALTYNLVKWTTIFLSPTHREHICITYSLSNRRCTMDTTASPPSARAHTSQVPARAHTSQAPSSC